MGALVDASPPSFGSALGDDDDDDDDAMGERRLLLKARQRRQIRQLTLLLGSCLALFCLVFVWRTPSDDDYGDINRPPSMRVSPYVPRPALPSEVLENLSLGEGECEATFPGLTKEIDDAVAQGPFKVKQTGDLGPLQGRIKDGKVCLSRKPTPSPCSATGPVASFI